MAPPLVWLKTSNGGTPYDMAQRRHHRIRSREDVRRLVVRGLLLGHVRVELGDVNANAPRGDRLHFRGTGLRHELVGPDGVLRNNATRGKS